VIIDINFFLFNWKNESVLRVFFYEFICEKLFKNFHFIKHSSLTGKAFFDKRNNQSLQQTCLQIKTKGSCLFDWILSFSWLKQASYWSWNHWLRKKYHKFWRIFNEIFLKIPGGKKSGKYFLFVPLLIWFKSHVNSRKKGPLFSCSPKSLLMEKEEILSVSESQGKSPQKFFHI